MKRHVHKAPCRPCREGRHHACIPVRTYGERPHCRYVCDCGNERHR